MKSTFSIIFYLKRQVVKKDGTVPVMGRITVDGTQAQFSCKTTANPNLWDTYPHHYRGAFAFSIVIYLQAVRSLLRLTYLFLRDEETYRLTVFRTSNFDTQKLLILQ